MNSNKLKINYFLISEIFIKENWIKTKINWTLELKIYSFRIKNLIRKKFERKSLKLIRSAQIIISLTIWLKQNNNKMKKIYEIYWKKINWKMKKLK